MQRLKKLLDSHYLIGHWPPSLINGGGLKLIKWRPGLTQIAPDTDLDDVVPAKVEGGQGGAVAEGGAGQTPDVVVGQVEDLELAQAPEGLRPQLQGHRAGPLAVVSLHPELPEVLEADEGAVRKHFQFTELHTELRQLG